MPVVIYAPVKGGRPDGSVGKLVEAFLAKLYRDDTAPGLHIEPIQGSADPKVRTGRVNDGYRAVLFKITGRGQDHYVYTGTWQHDEAIDIAMKAVLTTNPVNALPELTMSESPSPVAPREVPRQAPPAATQPSILQTARPDLDADYLAETFGIDPEITKTAWAITDQDAYLTFASRLGGWRGEVLLAVSMGDSIQDIQESLQIGTAAPAAAAVGDEERLLSALETPAGQMQFKWIEDDEELRGVIEGGDLAAWRVFLHPVQRDFVTKNYSGPARLSGGAGTGKTVVLIHRARRLAKEKPNARILLTTYTRNLADGMKRALRELDPQITLANYPGAPGVYVSSVDATAHQVLTEASEGVAELSQQVLGTTNRGSGRTTDTAAAWRQAITTAGADLAPEIATAAFFETEYAAIVLPGRITQRSDYLRARRSGRGTPLNRAARNAVWNVIESYRASAAVEGDLDFGEVCALAAAWVETAPKFDHALVDEGQDLAPTRWQFLRAVAASGPNDLFIAEDSQQRIYGERVTLKRYGINIVGRSRRLKLNYRTTAEVLGLATKILAGEPYVDMEETDVEATGYRSARSGRRPSLLGSGTFATQLDEAAGVLTRWRDEEQVEPEGIGVLVRDQRMADRVHRGLEDRGVRVQLVGRRSRETGDPQLLTMHRAKGLEFTHVLIVGATADMLPAEYLMSGLSDDERADLIQRERSLFYVAATRARDELVITWDGEPTSFLKGADPGGKVEG